jgi:hypothetical protein
MGIALNKAKQRIIFIKTRSIPPKAVNEAVFNDTWWWNAGVEIHVFQVIEIFQIVQLLYQLFAIAFERKWNLLLVLQNVVADSPVSSRSIVCLIHALDGHQVSAEKSVF